MWAAYRVAVADAGYYLSDVEVLAAAELAGVDVTVCRERGADHETDDDLYVLGRSGGAGGSIRGAMVLRGQGEEASRSHFEVLRRAGAAGPAGAAAATPGDGSAAEAAAEGGDAGMEIDGEGEEWLDAASDVVFPDADKGPSVWADDLSSA